VGEHANNLLLLREQIARGERAGAQTISLLYSRSARVLLLPRSRARASFACSRFARVLSIRSLALASLTCYRFARTLSHTLASLYVAL
jgi:hypothetical protein